MLNRVIHVVGSIVWKLITIEVSMRRLYRRGVGGEYIRKAIT